MSTGTPLRLFTRAASIGPTDYLPFNKIIGGLPFSRSITLSDFASSAIAQELLLSPTDPIVVNTFKLQRVTFNNANYAANSTDRQIIQVGTMTAPRTVVLPAASSVRASEVIKVKDQSGTVTTVNTISVIRNGATSDTVNGGTTALISQGYGEIEFESDGVSSWTYKPSSTSSPTVITSLNVESMYNPLNPIYGAAGNGADDLNAVKSCCLDALVGNNSVHLPIFFRISQGINLPNAGFKEPTIQSVNTSTSTITYALPHGKLPGDVVMHQGMAPAGSLPGVVYFGSFETPSDTGLYTDQKLAIAGGSTGRVALTGGVTTTGTISQGSRNLAVAAELGAQIGTTLTIAGAAGSSGGFSVVGGVGTGTLILNTTANTGGVTLTNVLVTYNCWIDWRFFDGGFKMTASPGGGLGKHHTWQSRDSAALLNFAIGSNVQLLNCIFEGISNMYVPWGTTGTINANTNILTVNDATWARKGMAITIGDYGITSRIRSISGNVITLMANVPNTVSYTGGSPAVIRGTITSGVIGLTGTGTAGSSSVTMNSVDGLFGTPGGPSLSVMFDNPSGSPYGPFTITSVNTSTKVITVSPTLPGNLSGNLLYLTSDAGDDGVRMSSIHKAKIDGCIFRHFGDSAFRAQTNVADYSAATASNPFGGVNTGEIVFTNNYLFNIYQTSTTTNDYIHGGATNVIFENNTFDMLVGSVKFANRVPGARNLTLTKNTILSSYNHGFEIDSYTLVKTYKNQLSNIYNQGMFIIANNGPAGTLGQGVIGFPFGGFYIDGDVFDNVGLGAGVSCLRIGPDSYSDGSRFDFPGLHITNCKFLNISNTTSVVVNVINGSLINFRFENNDYDTNCQAANLLKMTLRSSTSAGFVNGFKIKNCNFNMNNASAVAVDIRGTIGTTSIQPQINEIDIEDCYMGGLCSQAIILENCSNVRLKNIRQNLIGGTFFLPNNQFGYSRLTNISFKNCDLETTNAFGYSLAGINGLRIIDNRHKITPLTAALTNGSNTIVVGSTSGLSQGISGSLSGLNGSGVNYQQNYTILSVVDSTHLTIYPTPTDTVASAKMSVNGPLAGFSTASISNSCTNVTYLNNEENGGAPNFNQIPVKTKSRASILREEEGTVFPTAGTWLAGSRFNLITSNGATAWIFETSGTFGTPTGSPTATTNGTDNTVTFSSLAAISEGSFINVAGAWTGARQILNIDPIAKTGVVVGSTPTAVTSAAVTYVVPTFGSLSYIEPVTFSDQDLTMTSTQREAEQIGTMSAPRTVTLPAANSVTKGTIYKVCDTSGTVNSTNTLIVSRAGSDGIVTPAGIVPTVTMTAPSDMYFRSNGVNKWSFK